MVHRRWLLALVVLLGVIAASQSPVPARAATTRTWTGAVDAKWSTAGNWSPAGAPVNGDAVVFPGPGAATTVTNDLVELSLASLTLNNGFLTIVGNRLGISSTLAVPAAGGNPTLDLPIVLRGDIQVTLANAVRLFMRERLTPIGNVALDVNGHSLTRTGGDDMEFNGDIVGGGSITSGGTYFSAHVPLSFAGTITLNAGTEAIIGRIGLPGDFCGAAASATFVLNNAALTGTCATTFGAVTGSGKLTVFSDSSVTIRGKSGAVFDGNVVGVFPRQLSCCSSSEQTFRGVSTFTGFFSISNGKVTLDGAAFPAASSFSVTSNGVLAGYGSFGDTILTGSQLRLAPVGGQFGLARFPGLQFAPDVSVAFTIRGATPGVGFTQILMSGQIVLDNANLALDFGSYVPPVGQSFTLVKNATALLDTFGGLNEGATFTAGGFRFKITYQGGAGNDVIITRQADPTTPTPSPTPTSTPTGMLANRRFAPNVAKD